MAFAANFAASSTSNGTITLTDTSTGSDVNLTGRTVSLFKIDNTLLTGVTISWPIGQSSITLSVLDKDYSLNIYVAWASSAPIGGSTYTNSHVFTATGYTNTFLYTLLQNISVTPSVLNNSNYVNNLNKMYTFLDSANQAQAFLDQFKSQFMLNLAYQMITNQSTYF